MKSFVEVLEEELPAGLARDIKGARVGKGHEARCSRCGATEPKGGGWYGGLEHDIYCSPKCVGDGG